MQIESSKPARMIYKSYSFKNLPAFESAARHLSFTQAAKELCITQAAVSHQIKQLEEDLGLILFHRLTRNLILTEEGKKLSKVVGEALQNINSMVDSLKKEEEPVTITISTLPSFAVKWLIPRLRSFNQAFPGIQLNIHADEKPVNLKEYHVDLAVRLGKGFFPGLHTKLLMKEFVYPVCSPSLLNGKSGLDIKEIYNYTLLEDDVKWDLGHDQTDWSYWLNQMGLHDLDSFSGISFSDSNMALQAAIDGLGLAICRTSLESDDLSTGRLIKPFNAEVESPNAYYLVCLPEKAHQIKIIRVSEWLIQQVNKNSQGRCVSNE